MPGFASARGLAALALLARGASANLLEVYYGPYCPNSANWMGSYLQPLLTPQFWGQLPQLQMVVLPYAMDPATGQMPAQCPNRAENNMSPCGTLAAPMCALQQFTAPQPYSAFFVQRVNFAICDVTHANHGRPAMLTHTPNDMAVCAQQSQMPWDANIQGCVANGMPTPQYIGKMAQANGKIPPGVTAPFILFDGVPLSNTEPLLQQICPKMGNPPACAAAGVTRLYDGGAAAVGALPSGNWAALIAAGAVVSAAAGLAALWRYSPSKKRSAQGAQGLEFAAVGSEPLDTQDA